MNRDNQTTATDSIEERYQKLKYVFLLMDIYIFHGAFAGWNRTCFKLPPSYFASRVAARSFLITQYGLSAFIHDATTNTYADILVSAP